jgi:hypothetical protein
VRAREINIPLDSFSFSSLAAAADISQLLLFLLMFDFSWRKFN